MVLVWVEVQSQLGSLCVHDFKHAHHVLVCVGYDDVVIYIHEHQRLDVAHGSSLVEYVCCCLADCTKDGWALFGALWQHHPSC